jgi:hypothetical protein
MRSTRKRFDPDAANRLEGELVSVVMDQIRPALNAVFRDLQGRIEALVGEAVGHELARSSRLRRIGEVKRCSVCGLPGARNLAALGRDHSQEEHQLARAKPGAASRKRTPAAVAATAAAAPVPVRDQLRVAG